MPVKRPSLVTGEIYHIVMRGIERRVIFPKKEDYFRFIHDLFEFNDEDTVLSTFRIRCREQGNNITGTVPVMSDRRKRKLLVKILAFCLMPNHFHLLFYQLKKNGISHFMRKMGGYVTYINQKYNRAGHLYQGRFRAVHIKGDSQLRNVFVYIHTNPIELIESTWKTDGIKNFANGVKFLEKYRYSSYLDYIGKRNFPSVTNRELFEKIFKTPRNCQKFIKDWILHKTEIRNLKDIILE